jgi:sulfate adenylyltransferase large subunit
MEKNNINIVIVGHIDHGKSTLIGKLLLDTNSLSEDKVEEIKKICNTSKKVFEIGYVMDNLEEERDQGITIDTTQTFFKTKKRNYTIIDAPGHVEFIKNMITGASQAEAAILIIDAAEGVQTQTRRHAYILNLLGLKQIIVVINKMDTIDYNEEIFNTIKTNILKFLNTIELSPKEIIPISAKGGDFVVKKSNKLKWYSGPTVLDALDILKPIKLDIDKPLRFSVQDVYKWDKRIIVGRVESGIMKTGQKIKILPSMEETTIKSIEETFKKNTSSAEAGKSTGFVTSDKLFLDRGNIISDPQNLPKVKDEFKAHIFWMDKNPLSKGEPILLKCSTQKVICYVEKFEKIINSSTLKEINSNEIKNNEVAEVIIKTKTPIVIENFNDVNALGRFVLERINTCAGGIITQT